MKYLQLLTIPLSLIALIYAFSSHTSNARLGTAILTTASSDTLNTFRTNVNTSLANLNASSTQYIQGFVQLATQSQVALGTASSSIGSPLVLPAHLATSTYNSATAANRVVVTKDTGFIDSGFLTDFGTTTTIGAFPAWQIGKQKYVITTTGTSTFSIPSGIQKLSVELVGGGGGGGDCTTSSNSGGAGGGGGYSWEIVDVSATTSVQVYVAPASASGGAGNRTTFGTIGSHFLTATGGVAGSADSHGGAGGVGADGDVNIEGEGGGAGSTTSEGSPAGGSSQLGGGGRGFTTGTASGGVAGGNYGGGGSGGSCLTGGGTDESSTGAQGVIIIRW